MAWALFLASLFTSYSNSQTIDTTTGLDSTGNVLNLGGGLPWTQTVTGQAGGTSGGGSAAAYNPSTGNIIFTYSTTTISQSIAINQALANAGTGIQLSGYKYSWDINNDLSNSGGNRGTLTGNVSLTGAGGSVLDSYNYNYSQTNTGSGFQNFSGTQLFSNQYQLSAIDKLTVSFTGKDQNFLPGYWGPRVHVNDVSLLYSVDPCKTNPSYSSTCAGFNKIQNTNNLLDSTKGGSYLNQVFAINTALENAGVGATVHGFNYGFNWRVGTGFFGCTAWNQDGSCSWTMNNPAYANATVSLTNNNSKPSVLYSKTYNFTDEGTSGSVSEKYLLPSSINQSLLGTGRITGTASGTGSSIEGAWATMIYTADPCVTNPLYSSTCKGYAYAMAKQAMAGANTNTTIVTMADSTQPIDTTARIQLDPSQPPKPTGSPPPPPPGSEPPPGGPPPPNATQTASSNFGAPPAANQPPPQGGSSQPKAGEVKTAGDNKSSSPVSLSSVLSMISSNQARIGNEAKSVVQAAESAATQATASAQQQAETIAGSAVMQSTSSTTMGTSVSSGSTARTSTQTQVNIFSLSTGQTATTSSIEAIRPPVHVTTTETSQSLGTGLSIPTLTYQFTQPSTQSSNVFSTVESPLTNFGFQLQFGRTSTQVESESFPQLEEIKIGGRSTLNDAIEQRPVLTTSTSQEQKTDAVNRNVQPNEVAGKVDIATMATQPTGYQAYSMMMPDVAFYAPKEIYKNQVNVDNARTLRGLQSGSDRLHKDLVNQQYKGK